MTLQGARKEDKDEHKELSIFFETSSISVMSPRGNRLLSGKESDYIFLSTSYKISFFSPKITRVFYLPLVRRAAELLIRLL